MSRGPWLRVASIALTAVSFSLVCLVSPIAMALSRSNCNKVAAEVGGDVVGGLAGVADAVIGQQYGNSVCINPYNGARYPCYNPYVQQARSTVIYAHVSEGAAELICAMTEKDHEEWEKARNEVLDGEKQATFDASYDRNSKVVGSVEVIRNYKSDGQSCRDVRTHMYSRSDRSESGTIDEKYCVNSNNTWELVKE